MSKKEYPSIAYLRQCLREENGKVFWMERPEIHFATFKAYKCWNGRHPGKEAGGLHINRTGSYEYPKWEVSVAAVQYPRAMIVWAIRQGEWVLWIDHKNRNSLDDRFENLRVATPSQNCANATARKTASGVKSVQYVKDSRKWMARLQVNGTRLYLGLFATPEEAHAAYVAAAKTHFGEFACGG